MNVDVLGPLMENIVFCNVFRAGGVTKEFEWEVDSEVELLQEGKCPLCMFHTLAESHIFSFSGS